MKQNAFKAELKRGAQQVGIWVSNIDPLNAEVIAGAGYDWAVLDMEHSPNNMANLGRQLQAFAGTHTTPLARPIWNDRQQVKQIMDLGTPGLLFPMVETRAEAQKAVAATRYPPRGNRGVAGLVRATNFGRNSSYRAEVEAQTCILLQLESRSALAQAEAIADVEGLDGIFFGPADISADLGQGGDPTAPKVWATIMPVAERLMKRGLPVGTLTLDPDHAKELFAAGFSFVACGMDLAILARGADALLANLRNALKH